MTSPNRWAELYKRFDPEELATKPEWHADRAYNTVMKIAAGLERPFGEKRYLLLGTVGTGKSTELYRVAAARAKKGPVVLFDIHGHFTRTVRDPSALQHVQPWETLLLAGLAIYAAGEKRFHKKWPREISERFRDSISALSGTSPDTRMKLDLSKLASAVFAVVGGPIAGAIGSSAGKMLEVGAGALGEIVGVAEDWNLPIGLPRHDALRDQDQRVYELLLSVNAVIRELQQDSGPLTLVIDGLDRVYSVPTTKQLFLESTLLGSLECATVVAGPLMLQREKLASQIHKFEAKILANLPTIRVGVGETSFAGPQGCRELRGSEVGDRRCRGDRSGDRRTTPLDRNRPQQERHRASRSRRQRSRTPPPGRRTCGCTARPAVPLALPE